MGYTLKDVLASDSVLKDGIDLFTRDPSQFVALIEQNIHLAKKFAETFTQEQVKTLFNPGLFSYYKLLTKILALIPALKYTPALTKLLTLDPAFKETYEKTLKLESHEMLEAMGESRLTFYDIDNERTAYQHGMYAKLGNGTKKRFAYAYAYIYVTNNTKIVKPVCWCYLPKFLGDNNIFIPADDLREIYHEMITCEQYVSMIISICKTLLKQLPTDSYLLDSEFSTKLWGDNPDARLFSSLLAALQFKLKPEIFSLTSKIIARTSPDVVLKELSTDVFRTVIKQLPMSNKAFTQIIRTFEQVAKNQGYRGLKKAVGVFNFDILKALEEVKSKRPYALTFYRIGEMALSDKGQNVMVENYPQLGPKYQALIEQEKIRIQKKEYEIKMVQNLATAPPPVTSTTNSLVFNPLNPLAPPPPYEAQPCFNPEAIDPKNKSGYPTI